MRPSFDLTSARQGLCYFHAQIPSQVSPRPEPAGKGHCGLTHWRDRDGTTRQTQEQTGKTKQARRRQALGNCQTVSQGASDYSVTSQLSFGSDHVDRQANRRIIDRGQQAKSVIPIPALSRSGNLHVYHLAYGCASDSTSGCDGRYRGNHFGRGETRDCDARAANYAV